MLQLHGVSEEDMKLFCEHLDNQVLMQRALSIVRQCRLAQAARNMGGQRPLRGRDGSLIAAPQANIDSSYYFTRMFEEREHNSARAESGENVWNDPEFLPWELKRNESLRPIVDHSGAPVHFGGVQRAPLLPRPVESQPTLTPSSHVHSELQSPAEDS